MREEAQRKATEEPILGSYFHATILNHKSFADALSFRLASKLDNPMLPTMLIRDVIAEAADAHTDILSAAEIDIIANFTRDPACRDLSSAFLFLKGYHALQAHRIANWLWYQERHTLAQFFQNQISVTLGVDIHPAARIGSGIMFDHATGIVIGETAVEDDVSVLHSVTLAVPAKAVVTGTRKSARACCFPLAVKLSATLKLAKTPKWAPAASFWKTYRQMPPWQGYRQKSSARLIARLHPPSP